MPQKRLTTSSAAHQLHACEDCRSEPCSICGKPVLRAAKARTCSPECHAEYQRRYQLAYYHSIRATDPEDSQKRRARSRARWADLTPEEKRAIAKQRREIEGRDRINERARERHAVRSQTEPEYLERKKEAREKHIAADPDRAREYDRVAAAKRRAKIATVETLHALEKLREKSDGE